MASLWINWLFVSTAVVASKYLVRFSGWLSFERVSSIKSFGNAYRGCKCFMLVCTSVGKMYYYTALWHHLSYVVLQFCGLYVSRHSVGIEYILLLFLLGTRWSNSCNLFFHKSLGLFTVFPCHSHKYKQLYLCVYPSCNKHFYYLLIHQDKQVTPRSHNT